jgi:DNA segregation ATPase FtsK/SpoIIIE, S-DNA-T family
VVNKGFYLMGRKKKKKKKDGLLSSFREETIETVFAIGFFVVAALLIFASFGNGGIVGENIALLLTRLFGLGYYLLPVILIILGISFFREIKSNLAIPKVLASIILFISGLGFVELVFEGGGLAGGLLAKPLVALFDFWFSLILVIAIAVLSVVIVFEASIKANHFSTIFGIFRKKKDDEYEDQDIRTNLDVDEEHDDEYEDDEEYEDEADASKTATVGFKPKKGNGLVFFAGNGLSKKEFVPPPLSLLSKDSGKPGTGDIKANANIIRRTLYNFGIQVEMDEISIGPSVTRYALKPAEGVKLAKIVALQRDLSLALAADPLRIEAPIPGKSLVGIEIPNSTKTTVGLGTLLNDSNFQDAEKPLLVCLGKGITGMSHFSNLAKMPHMLIAGATGSGKSVTIHALITSLLYRNSPDNLKFIMVDPKRVELTLYNQIPHLLTNVITDAKKAILALKWAGKEMDRRYDILEQNSSRDIESYQENIMKPAVEKAKKSGNEDDLPPSMPYIVIIIDELADIMQAYPRELESAIVRLAQMSRAVGIHLMLSTQRPSVNVITGLIKANIPTRIALQVASQIDSRTILDQPGAEKLLGSGDMLYMSGEMSKPVRIQSAFISEKEVKKVSDWLAKNYERDEVELELEEKSGGQIFMEALDSQEDDEDLDDMFEEARELVVRAGKASTSYIQRKMSIGYARAARIMDQLEERGIVGPENGSKPREILTGEDDGYGDDEEYEDNDGK